jgi:hypothetical protein
LWLLGREHRRGENDCREEAERIHARMIGQGTGSVEFKKRVE